MIIIYDSYANPSTAKFGNYISFVMDKKIKYASFQLSCLVDYYCLVYLTGLVLSCLMWIHKMLKENLDVKTLHQYHPKVEKDGTLCN